jgi:hypothetical protein
MVNSYLFGLYSNVDALVNQIAIIGIGPVIANPVQADYFAIVQQAFGIVTIPISYLYFVTCAVAGYS